MTEQQQKMTSQQKNYYEFHNARNYGRATLGYVYDPVTNTWSEKPVTQSEKLSVAHKTKKTLRSRFCDLFTVEDNFCGFMKIFCIVLCLNPFTWISVGLILYKF